MFVLIPVVPEVLPGVICFDGILGLLVDYYEKRVKSLRVSSRILISSQWGKLNYGEVKYHVMHYFPFGSQN